MQQGASAQSKPVKADGEEEEDDDSKLSITCLFCPLALPSMSEFDSHSSQHHAFQLASVSSSLQLDFYGRVRLVNYARQAVKDGFAASDVLQAVQSGGGWLADDRYLQPVLEDDALLCQLEDDDDGDDDWGEDAGGQTAENAEEDAEDDDDDDDSEDGETTVRSSSQQLIPLSAAASCISADSAADCVRLRTEGADAA